MIDGLPMIQLHWHFWIALATCVIVNLIIMTNQYFHHYQKWLYIAMPIVFSIIIYYAAGIILALLEM